METAGIAIIFAITGWMLRTWLTHQERMKALSVDQQRIGAAEQRLQRVEQAVDSIAIEVERIGEGQRYVTSLLQGGAVAGIAGASSAALEPSPAAVR